MHRHQRSRVPDTTPTSASPLNSPPWKSPPLPTRTLPAVACPDGHRDITDVVDDGERPAVEATWTGTHNGPGSAPRQGEVPPTGRSVVLPFCGVDTRRDDRIAAVTVSLDQTTMLPQLGPVPEPAPAR